MKKYTETHEWIEVDNNIAVVGITSDGIDEIGDVVSVELPEKGSEIKKGDLLCSVESAKSVTSIYSPISGKIMEVNEEIKNNPELLNESPEDKGWLVKIKV